MTERATDPLLASDLPVGEWLTRLNRISALLYESSIPAWEVFEPARKEFAETISWLDFEGEISLASTSAREAITFVRGWNDQKFQSWRRAAEAAASALGATKTETVLSSQRASK